jgi:soluble lytic murein transglycosylase-like protein
MVGVVVLCGPAAAADHTVQPGESLVAIARRHGVSVAELVRLNGITDPNHLVAGATLRLPGSRSAKQSSRPSPAAAPSRRAPEKGPIFTLSDEQRRQISTLLERAAREFRVSPSLLKALTYTESCWQPDAVSAVGAIGIGQLLPATATWLAGMMGEPSLDVRSTADNIRMSAQLLRLLLDKAGGTKRALAAYYQGIGAVLEHGVTAGGARYAAVVTARQRWFR